MARYTELLNDYLTRNELPTIFDKIDGFKDLFIGTYIDSEIGYETELLFSIKLETKAKIVIPIYKERIEDVATALTKMKSPVKTVYTQADYGGRTNKRTDLPIDATDVTPSSIDETEKATDNTNVQESGLNAQDSVNLFRILNEQVHILVVELLKEFKPLFMGVLL